MSARMKLKVLSMNLVNESQIEAFEKARQTRDARFDGKFFIAVRTTGIYCRPICRVYLQPLLLKRAIDLVCAVDRRLRQVRLRGRGHQQR